MQQWSTEDADEKGLSQMDDKTTMELSYDNQHQYYSRTGFTPAIRILQKIG
jgi:superoxide dismutase|tara:strand:+ start:483 stop:635 length:153 start_codon:yes stop_codon:yes gene_type:complete